MRREPVRLHAEVEGPEGAPAVVLGPSLGTTLALWRPQVAALRRDFRVVAYDHRGHGGSPVPPGPAAIRAPTLVVAGAEDPATPPEHARAIAARIPGARLEILSPAAHLASLEQPEAVTRLLLEHLHGGR